MIEQLESAIAYELTDKAIPSISYALFNAGGITTRAHMTPPRAPPLTDDTLLRISSISKTFAAIAAMQQVERGRFELDAHVSRYLGAFHASWHDKRATVTLRRLLSDRSGPTREAGRGHYLADDDASLDATTDSLRSSRLKVAPDGSTFRYSNARPVPVSASSSIPPLWPAANSSPSVKQA